MIDDQSDYRYTLHAQGSYNRVYLVYQNEKIIGLFKEQVCKEEPPLLPGASTDQIREYIRNQEEADMDLSLDTLERSIKIWKEINPSLKAKKFTAIIDGEEKIGWLCEYVDGKQATDGQIVLTLIDIYERTGRIVVDAVGLGNVIMPSTGELAVCVDVGLAVKLDYEYGPLPRMRDTALHGDREDMPGMAQWRKNQTEFFEFLNVNRHEHSVDVIKSLLFLNYHRPEIKNPSFLEKRLNSQIFAMAYDKELTEPVESKNYVEFILSRLDARLDKTLSNEDVDTMMKSLLFLNKHRPELKNPSFLKNIRDAQKFAKYYDKELEDPVESKAAIKLFLSRLDKQIEQKRHEIKLKQNPVIKEETANSKIESSSSETPSTNPSSVKSTYSSRFFEAESSQDVKDSSERKDDINLTKRLRNNKGLS